MEKSKAPWIGMFIGSIIGGYIPQIWGAGLFSPSGIILSIIGALIGLYVIFKLRH
jgi:uncharacterized membrane protein YeaQ/YmgE (transglycosylase-associated protein family)